MFALVRDIRFAVHQLRKAPGFTATIVVTFALGIGATTAIFSLVESILLRPLPFANPQQLVLIGDHLGNNPGIAMTAREIHTYENASSAFSSLGSFIDTRYELSGGARPEEISATRMSPGTFAVLGVQPILGRLFTQKEDDAHEPLAVISYGLWLNRFHRDRLAVGNSIHLDRRSYTIIGVMPRDFEFPSDAGRLDRPQLWVPLSLTPDQLSDQNAGFWGYHMVARLREGVSPAEAALDVNRVAQQIMRNFPPGMSAIHIRGDATLLLESVVADSRPLLRMLFVAVGIVLLIACVNVAVLLLVRAVRRSYEHALRIALGAQPAAIVREAIAEGLILSLAGGLFGLALAVVAIHTALDLLPDSMPRINSVSIDLPVASFTLLLVFATGILCSIAPAFTAVGANPIDSLKDGARGGTGARSHAWLRKSLVTAEIAIALVLLTSSGAFLRSYQRMLAVDPGYRPDQVLLARYKLPLEHYPTHASVDAFNRELVGRLSDKPGVTSVGLSDMVPGADTYGQAAYTIETQPASGWKLKFAAFGTIYGDYFRSLSIPLLEGRGFTADDRAGTPLVVIVNQSMAEHSWPGQSALGKRMHVGNPKKGLPWATVVGVVGDARLGSRDEPAGDQWYAPARQPAILYGVDATGKLTGSVSGYITLHSTLRPDSMIPTLRQTVASVDPLLALEQIQTMSNAISNVEAPRRFNTRLITAFALGALLLAFSGIYAVVALSVSLRTQELAIRMALGAPRSGIARLVLLSSTLMALWGCGFGLLGSFALSKLVRSFLFDVSATDPAIYTASVLLILLVALLGSALPASRAASADPIEVLRKT
jgi:putative ABC transport system permease protein